MSFITSYSCISCHIPRHSNEYFNSWCDDRQLYYHGPGIARDVHYTQGRLHPLEDALDVRKFWVNIRHREVSYTHWPITRMDHNYSKIYIIEV